MKYIKIFSFIIFSISSLGANLWSQEKINQYEVLSLLNLARSNGPEFVKNKLTPYVTENGLERNRYVTSLKRTLSKTKGLAPLKMDAVLDSIAQSWAEVSGKRGVIGHSGIKRRLYRLNEKGAMAENCTYGSYTALDAVMDLLIDTDIPDLGHRKNILNPVYRKIGIGSADHKTYGIVLVMDFSVR